MCLSSASRLNVTFIYVGKIVLHKLKVRLDWLIEETFIYSHGRGICSAEVSDGAPVCAGVIEPVAGTIAPPCPDMSPGVLSMALEATADNLYFQVSSRGLCYNTQMD